MAVTFEVLHLLTRQEESTERNVSINHGNANLEEAGFVTEDSLQSGDSSGAKPASINPETRPID